jgi:chemotaxis response regulator CheB
MTQLRTLIVDGDVLCRDTLRTALANESDIEVVGAASSGKLGLDRVRQLRPDVVILDSGLSDVAAVDFTAAVLTASPQTTAGGTPTPRRLFSSLFPGTCLFS